MADTFLFDNEKDYLSFAEYADQHGLQDIFQHLLRLVLIDRPDDPVKFMIDHVMNPITPAIVVSAPPSSGRDEVCRLLAAKLGAVYISTGNLLRVAVEKQTSLGNQVKPYMEKNQLVPDAIINGVLFERLKEDDVRQRGWVLDGFPRTREQALAMQRKGALPTHFIRLNIPDAAILEHTSQLRVDPVTGKSYHLKISPPQNGAIAGRLQQRSYHSHAAVSARLELYRRNSLGVLNCFSHLMRGVSFDKGLFGAEPAAVDHIVKVLSKAEPYGQVAAGPKCYKVCVCGGPGSGKTMIAEALSRKFGMIVVSLPRLIATEVADKRKYHAELEPYLDNPEEAPVDIAFEMLADRVSRDDCVTHGWVLDGFPETKEQAARLLGERTAAASGLLQPNRVFWLSMPADVLARRLAARRVDGSAGSALVDAGTTTASGRSRNVGTTLPRDRDDRVRKRIALAAATEKELSACSAKIGGAGSGALETLEIPEKIGPRGAVEVAEAALLLSAAKNPAIPVS